MLLSKAIEGFLLHKSIERLSVRTLETYRQQLGLLTKFLDDREIETIVTHDLRRFFDHLRNEYIPTRWNGSQSPLSARSRRNYWIACRSFWSWLCPEFSVQDVMSQIPAPKANKAQTESLTEDEVKALLSTLGHYSDGRRHPHAHRNKAIILILLDCGLRASELCQLNVCDVNLKTGRVNVDGKGGKQRAVFLGKRARKAVWRYLSGREDRDDPATPLFVSGFNRPIKRQWLRRLISDIGKRAGVVNVYPHRFRHTFAIQYLRNLGDIFTLQRILGHSTLEMVRYYARIADVDVERVHRRASPVDNWAV